MTWLAAERRISSSCVVRIKISVFHSDCFMYIGTTPGHADSFSACGSSRDSGRGRVFSSSNLEETDQEPQYKIRDNPRVPPNEVKKLSRSPTKRRANSQGLRSRSNHDTSSDCGVDESFQADSESTGANDYNDEPPRGRTPKRSFHRVPGLTRPPYLPEADLLGNSWVVTEE